LVGDKPEFLKFVQKNIRELLAERGTTRRK